MSAPWARVVLFLAAAPLWAWGTGGHRVVALIAAKNLSPQVRAKLTSILETDDEHLASAMAEAALWPDRINRKDTGTGNWHFVDIPVTGTFEVGNLCAGHDCIIDQILAMSGHLRNNRDYAHLNARPDPYRGPASADLAFLIHFVGDLHQPLHASNNGDRGGNCLEFKNPVTHADGSITRQMHGLWDIDEAGFVIQKLGGEDAASDALFARYKNGAAVDQLSPLDWARESNSLARRGIYQKLRIPQYRAPLDACATGMSPIDLPSTYIESNRADVEQQLLRAGIRLSNILNEICAGDGCRPGRDPQAN